MADEEYYDVTRWVELSPKVKMGKVTGVDIRTITKLPPKASGPVIKMTLRIPKKLFANFETTITLDMEDIARTPSLMIADLEEMKQDLQPKKRD